MLFVLKKMKKPSLDRATTVRAIKIEITLIVCSVIVPFIELEYRFVLLSDAAAAAAVAAAAERRARRIIYYFVIFVFIPLPSLSRNKFVITLRYQH